LLTVFYRGDFPRLKWHLTDVTSSIFSAAFLASSIVKSFNKNLGNTRLNQALGKLLKTQRKRDGSMLAIWNKDEIAGSENGNSNRRGVRNFGRKGITH
jgi:hypothetical protein